MINLDDNKNRAMALVRLSQLIDVFRGYLHRYSVEALDLKEIYTKEMNKAQKLKTASIGISTTFKTSSDITFTIEARLSETGGYSLFFFNPANLEKTRYLQELRSFGIELRPLEGRCEDVFEKFGFSHIVYFGTYFTVAKIATELTGIQMGQAPIFAEVPNVSPMSKYQSWMQTIRYVLKDVLDKARLDSKNTFGSIVETKSHTGFIHALKNSNGVPDIKIEITMADKEGFYIKFENLDMECPLNTKTFKDRIKGIGMNLTDANITGCKRHNNFTSGLQGVVYECNSADVLRKLIVETICKRKVSEFKW